MSLLMSVERGVLYRPKPACGQKISMKLLRQLLRMARTSLRIAPAVLYTLFLFGPTCRDDDEHSAPICVECPEAEFYFFIFCSLTHVVEPLLIEVST